MLISQSPSRLVCYAQLLFTAWMLREFTREHFKKRNSIERKTPYNIIRNSQLWLIGWCFGQIKVSSIYRHLRNSMEPCWFITIQEFKNVLDYFTMYNYSWETGWPSPFGLRAKMGRASLARKNMGQLLTSPARPNVGCGLKWAKTGQNIKKKC